MATWGDTAPRWRRDVMDQMERMEQQRAAKNAEIRRIEEARRQIAANRASTTPPWVLHPRKIADLLREAVPTMPNRQESALHKDALKAYDHLHDDMLLAMLKQIRNVKTNIEDDENLIWSAQAMDYLWHDLTKQNMGYRVPNIPVIETTYPFLSWEDFEPQVKQTLAVEMFQVGLPYAWIAKFADRPTLLEVKTGVAGALIQNIQLARAVIFQDDKGLEILRQEKREGGYPYKTVNTGMVQRAQEANMGGREYGQRHTAGATMLAGTMVSMQSSGWMMPVRGGAMGHGFVIEDVVKGNSVRVAMI